MPVIERDANGNFKNISASAVAVGIGTTEIGRELEVAGVVVVRTNGSAVGVAAGFASDSGGPGEPHGSLWTNPAFNPSTTSSPNEPFRRWIRTINMKGGNVGIGRSSAEVKDPSERLVVEGNLHVSETAILGGAFGGAGTAGQLMLRDQTGERIVALQAATGDFKIGGHGKD